VIKGEPAWRGRNVLEKILEIHRKKLPPSLNPSPVFGLSFDHIFCGRETDLNSST